MSKLLAMMMNKKYTRLEYIESTGTQYIDTLYTPTLNTKVRVVFSALDYKDWVGYFGSRKDPYRFCLTTFSNGANFAFSMSNNTWSNNKTTLELNKKYDCIAYNGKQIINGVEYNEPIVENWGDCGTFKLNRLISGTATTNRPAKYYSCQIWESGILVRDLVPVIRNSDNEIGMLDRVSGQFFGNAGIGKFRVPNEVGYTVVGTPTITDGVASGFSSSNYLELQNTITLSKDSNIEIVEKINIPSNKNSNSFIGTATRYGFALVITNNGNLLLYIGNSSGWNISGATGKSGTNILDINTDYYIKIKISNSLFNVYISTDNINYTLDNSIDISSLTTEEQYNLRLGMARNTSNYFNGSIDLNETWIKINNKLWFNGQPA